MSLSEFENLVERYLEGNISRAEELRLLKLVQETPEFKNRFKAKVRLHQAMNQCLSSDKTKQASLSFAWLRVYVKRMSQVASYACLIALVFVQFRVTLPSEYSGALYYLTATMSDDTGDFMEGISSDEILANSSQDEINDIGMPDFDSSDISSPMDEVDSSEV